MFVLKQKPAVWWPIVWNGYSETEPGAVVENRLQVKFLRKKRSELRKLFGDRVDLLEGAGVAERLFGDPLQDRDLFDELATGWRGLCSEDSDEELPFAEPWITAMIELPGFMAALVAGYLKFAGGLEETRKGNSKASPAGGPETAQAVAARNESGTTDASAR